LQQKRSGLQYLPGGVRSTAPAHLLLGITEDSAAFHSGKGHE